MFPVAPGPRNFADTLVNLPLLGSDSPAAVTGSRKMLRKSTLPCRPLPKKSVSAAISSGVGGGERVNRLRRSPVPAPDVQREQGYSKRFR